MKTAFKAAIIASLTFAGMSPACAEPVENGTEIAQLLEALGDRCWAVDLDGAVLDAAALSEVAGPIDLEVECVIAETTGKTARPLPSTVI